MDAVFGGHHVRGLHPKSGRLPRRNSNGFVAANILLRPGFPICKWGTEASTDTSQLPVGRLAWSRLAHPYRRHPRSETLTQDLEPPPNVERDGGYLSRGFHLVGPVLIVMVSNGRDEDLAQTLRDWYLSAGGRTLRRLLVLDMRCVTDADTATWWLHLFPVRENKSAVGVNVHVGLLPEPVAALHDLTDPRPVRDVVAEALRLLRNPATAA